MTGTAARCCAGCKPLKLPVLPPCQVIFTYDVVYKPSDIRWATRWDTYLLATDDQVGARVGRGLAGWLAGSSTGLPAGQLSTVPTLRLHRHLCASARCSLLRLLRCAPQVHWFSIINSLMIVLFLRCGGAGVRWRSAGWRPAPRRMQPWPRRIKGRQNASLVPLPNTTFVAKPSNHVLPLPPPLLQRHGGHDHDAHAAPRHLQVQPAGDGGGGAGGDGLEAGARPGGGEAVRVAGLLAV